MIQLGTMLGFFSNMHNQLVISNVIFNTLLYNHVLSKRLRSSMFHQPESSQFIQSGRLNMPQVLIKFQELMQTEYRMADHKFIEQQGRLLFLCFLKPIINGTGFYYVEPETRKNTRMDLVVAYGNEEHIIELKIWHGEQYRKEGISQLEEYMKSRHAKKGYLVSFCFKKKRKPDSGWIQDSEMDTEIFEVII